MIFINGMRVRCYLFFRQRTHARTEPRIDEAASRPVGVVLNRTKAPPPLMPAARPLAAPAAAPLALPGPVAPSAGPAHTYVQAPNVGWADDALLADVLGCDACGGTCGR